MYIYNYVYVYIYTTYDYTLFIDHDNIQFLLNQHIHTCSFPHVHFIPGSLPTGASHRCPCGRPRGVSAAPALWASAHRRGAGLCRRGRRESQETLRRCTPVVDIKIAGIYGCSSH